MLQWLRNLLNLSAPEEHRISIPGIEIAFNHATKTVWIVDQSGAASALAVQELEDWLTSRGYFLFGVFVTPDAEEK